MPRISFYLVSIIITMSGIIFIVTSQLIQPTSISSSILLNVGLTLCPIGAISFIYEFYLRRTLSSEIREEIKKIISPLEDNLSLLGDMTGNIVDHLDILKTSTELGIQAFYKDRTPLLSNYGQLFSNARREIHILGVSLMTIVHTTGIKDIFLERLNNNVKIKILALDPCSICAELRGKEKGIVGNVKQEIQTSLYMWNTIKKEAGIKSDFQIKVYDGMPKFFLLIIDETLFFEPYSVQFSSSELPCFRIKYEDGGIYKKFVEQFETIWQKAKLLDNEMMSQYEGK